MSNSETVRVRLRYADLDTFVERFAPNVTRGGVFLASRAPRPVGAEFIFEIQLASGQIALSGTGKVIWVKEHDPAQPQKPHGMGVQFVHIDPGSRETLNRMLKVKAARSGGASPGGGPRSPSQPLRPLGGSNGTAPAPRIDTSVDLAAEYGLDEAALRRVAVDVRLLAANRDAADQELDDLLKPDTPDAAPSLAQALSNLPRLLDPTARRRTGAFRTLEMMGIGDKTAPNVAPPADPRPAEPAPNGTATGTGTGNTGGGDGGNRS